MTIPLLTPWLWLCISFNCLFWGIALGFLLGEHHGWERRGRSFAKRINNMNEKALARPGTGLAHLINNDSSGIK